MSRLIDADALIGSLHQYGFCDGDDRTMVYKVIRLQPTIEPERKRGRLEYVDYGGFGNWHCTACRQIIICNGDYDFCPYCGADLREGEQS